MTALCVGTAQRTLFRLYTVSQSLNNSDLDKQHASLIFRRHASFRQQSLCREACMGPVRSLFEHESDLEKVLSHQPPGGGAVTLRPVEMSDCGEEYAYYKPNHR